jgi:NADH:ubiquinone oxidoreductase subunit F (NADH-binding)
MSTSEWLSGLAVGTSPGIEPRLLHAMPAQTESLSEYERSGGYARQRLVGEQLIEAVESAGLRGRGGAAFPTGMKMRAVRDRPGPRFIVANGEEGEPASVKDRWLLRHRPHLVLDGLLLAAAAIEVDRAYVFVSDRSSAQQLAAAIAELPDGTLQIELATTTPAYVAGEETAVIRAIGGGPALPVDKPPRPFEEGIEGRPTMVANVETLANIPGIATYGAEAFRQVGTATSPGTFLLTLSGACPSPGLYEVPLGTTLRELPAQHERWSDQATGFLLGGFFGGVLGRRALDLRLGYDEARAEGSGLGCGAIVVLGAEDCAVAAVADVMSYFERENAKQCGACIRGTAAMRDVVRALAQGTADVERVERLRSWSMSLRERGACALLDGAAGLAGSLLREFPESVAQHLASPCSRCAELVSDELPTTTRFRLDIDIDIDERD